MSLTIVRPDTEEVPCESGDLSAATTSDAVNAVVKTGDPRWAPLAFTGLLIGTAFMYIWGLGASGWANSFYSAAVEAGTKSWKAFFFGSFDSSNFITVDKPPVSLWVMELSSRIFGVNSWSILVPEALEGVASVAVLYFLVRRIFGFRAGLLAGAALATTPVATLMFRFNNPDALLVLLLVGAAYATMRAIETGRTRWLLLMSLLVGTGFLTKMLQAFLVVPAFGFAYLLFGPPKLWQRIRQLVYAAVAMVAAAGWWVAVVQIVPSKDRPYVGGSTDNSELNLIFGYNGFGRLDGNETGSVHGAGAIGSIWGPTGWDRMFNSTFGGQISWLIPAALVLLLGGLWFTKRAARTDMGRAAFVMWGLYLLVTGITFSLGQGIIHPYYSVALAPAIAALIGIGGVTAWRHRDEIAGRIVMAVATLATAIWAYELLNRSPDWLPWLRSLVLATGIAGTAGILGIPLLRRIPERLSALRQGIGASAAGLALVAGLAGPLAYSMNTLRTAQSGAIPSAGPAVAAGSGFPGRAGGRGGAGFPGGSFGRTGTGFPGAHSGTFPAGGFPGGSSSGGFPGAGHGSGGFPVGGVPPNGGAGLPGGGTFPTGGRGTGGFPSRGAFGRGRGGFGAGGSAGGGLLNASTPGKALVAALEAGAGKYSWVAAVTGANSAAGYQLATDDAVMAIGGFNGTDPAPSLSVFKTYVSQHKVHYYIAGGGGAGPGLQGGSSGDASAIETWVKANFKAETIDGVTLYNLSNS